jgi:hypothetical protein
MYGCDPLKEPTMLFATQPQDQAHEIIAELNKADDLNRRACAAPAAQSWAAGGSIIKLPVNPQCLASTGTKHITYFHVFP